MPHQSHSSPHESSIREEIAGSWPFFALVSLVIAGGYITALLSNQSLRELPRLAVFTMLILLHGGLYWFVGFLMTARRWLPAYFVVQGALAFAIGLLTPGHWLGIALHMSLAGLLIGALWPNLRASILAAVICFALLVLNLAVSSWNPHAIIEFLPLVGFMLMFVFVYVTLLVQQVEARQQAQRLLRELEAAHQQLQDYANQVEELTISQERERMARELHDTLAQGLAGLILQLEAADSHIESENVPRAQAVVQQAMQRARTTLDEARRAIQALRPSALEEGGLIHALQREIDQFTATTGVPTTFDGADSLPELPADLAQNILRIVQESLTNAARHADASHVLVQIVADAGKLQVIVQDDGVGFDLNEGMERPGCFGLAGMYERAERVGGELDLESTPGKGTKVVLNMGSELEKMSEKEPAL
jgi:NarL family two-component system sensor histidine kinase YdfH